MIGWASKNAEEALQGLGREADAETRRRVMGAAIRGLALTEPDLAVKALEDQPAKERDQYAGEFVTSMLRSVSIDEAKRLVEGMVSRAADTGSLKAEYLKQVFNDYSRLRIGQSAASGTLSDSAQWLGQHVGQPYLDRRILAEAAGYLALQDPQESFRWLEGVNTTLLRAGEQSTVGYRVLMDTWKAKAGAPVVETWLQAQAAHPHYDHMAWQYAALVIEQDPSKALKWANTIKDGAIKKEVMKVIDRRAPRAKS
jgi:hypothetical protein